MNRLGAGMTQLGWLSVVRLSTAWILPPAWAYAILRHQVIPIRLMIRRSAQYLLARSALRTLIALPVIGLLFEVNLISQSHPVGVTLSELDLLLSAVDNGGRRHIGFPS